MRSIAASERALTVKLHADSGMPTSQGDGKDALRSSGVTPP